MDTSSMEEFSTKHCILTTSMKKWYLENHGIKVQVQEDQMDEMLSWCREKCQKLWDWSDYSQLTTLETLLANAEYAATGKWSEVYQEYQMSNHLAKELGYKNFGRSYTPGVCNFWFESSDEALLFKLTWGGS